VTTPGPAEVRAALRETRRLLAELQETQGWVHHVGDLDSGEVLTTPLDRPPTPMSRAERLSMLGPPWDWTIFDGPSYRLTPRVPYQASPEAFLIAELVSFTTFDDRITWQLPQNPGPGQSGVLRAHFAVSPDRRSLVSISLAGLSWPGAPGEVSVSVANNTALVRVPIGEEFASHTIDVTFDPNVPETDILMILQRIRLVDFHAIAFRAAPLVAHAGGA
jgi:hypothetical protein